MPRSQDGRWTKNCQVCGTEFQQRTPGVITCSYACRAQLPHNTGGKRPTVGLAPRKCITCGREFQPYRSNGLTCSRECYRKTQRWRELQQEQDQRPERKARKNELRRGSERVRQYNRKKQLERYGVTVEQHDAMLEEQRGLCALCGNPPKPGGIRAASRLHLDHDHETGKPRQLLCNTCNQGLGYLKDDPALLRAAADYIERHRQS
jgi:hypothetical protein